ncbi:MAG: tetratricopeptide repeat protein [Cyanobacteriota/Melainabacteria group bacterium]
MDKFSLVSIGISQASSIAFKKFFEEVEKGWNWLFDTVVKEAIEDTAKELSLGNPKQEEELKRALITWKKHESFSIVRKEIERASISGTVISADATANSLVSVEIIETSGISPDQLAACFVKHWVARAIAADKKYGNRVTAIGAQQVNAIPLEKSEILSSIPLIEMEKQNGEKTELEIRVDEAAKLLNAQKIESATILLKDIRREVSGKTDVLKSTLSRIATNLGVAYLRNELYDDAEAEFEAALEAEPNSSVTQINLAQVYYLRERPDAALSHSRTAYAMTPEDSQVIAAHLLILADNDWDSYQEFMTENLEFIESHSICQFALGQVEFERKENLPKAIQYFVNSKKLDETNVQCRFMLATTLLVQVQNELLTNTPSDGRVTEPERSNLLIALTELDWVVETAKEFDSKTSTVKALNNRACIKLLLEDYDAALSDCNLALFCSKRYQRTHEQEQSVISKE